MKPTYLMDWESTMNLTGIHLQTSLVLPRSLRSTMEHASKTPTLPVRFGENDDAKASQAGFGWHASLKPMYNLFAENHRTTLTPAPAKISQDGLKELIAYFKDQFKHPFEIRKLELLSHDEQPLALGQMPNVIGFEAQVQLHDKQVYSIHYVKSVINDEGNDTRFFYISTLPRASYKKPQAKSLALQIEQTKPHITVQAMGARDKDFYGFSHEDTDQRLSASAGFLLDINVHLRRKILHAAEQDYKTAVKDMEYTVMSQVPDEMTCYELTSRYPGMEFSPLLKGSAPIESVLGQLTGLLLSQDIRAVKQLPTPHAGQAGAADFLDITMSDGRQFEVVFFPGADRPANRGSLLEAFEIYEKPGGQNLSLQYQWRPSHPLDTITMDASRGLKFWHFGKLDPEEPVLPNSLPIQVRQFQALLRRKIQDSLAAKPK